MSMIPKPPLTIIFHNDCNACGKRDRFCFEEMVDHHGLLEERRLLVHRMIYG